MNLVDHKYSHIYFFFNILNILNEIIWKNE